MLMSKVDTVFQSPYLNNIGVLLCVHLGSSYLYIPVLYTAAWPCWFMFYFWPTVTCRLFSTQALPSQLLPSLYLCHWLFLPNCSYQIASYSCFQNVKLILYSNSIFPHTCSLSQLHIIWRFSKYIHSSIIQSFDENTKQHWITIELCRTPQTNYSYLFSSHDFPNSLV